MQESSGFVVSELVVLDTVNNIKTIFYIFHCIISWWTSKKSEMTNLFDYFSKEFKFEKGRGCFLHFKLQFLNELNKQIGQLALGQRQM